MDGRRLPMLVALAAMALHFAAIGQYGYFRDELYYIACSGRLAWGYVDHPPLSIALLRVVRGVLGDSLPAVRLLAVAAGGASVYLTGRLCARMGGGAIGQTIAMASVALGPAYLFTHHVYSMNAFDVLFWVVAASVLARIFDGGGRSDWILLGVVLGLGLLNKIDVLWLGLGLVIGLRFTEHRGWFLTPWPWASGALAFGIFFPHVAWQVARGWPTLQFIRNATHEKVTSAAPWEFLARQALVMNPAMLLVALAGLAYLLLPGEGRRFRPFALVFLTVLVLLLTFPGSRPSYLAPAYPPLFAAGGVAVERWRRRVGRPWIGTAAVVIVVASGLAIAPVTLPILPAETYVRYVSALGIGPSTDERHEMGALPQHYADMFGWESIVADVAKAYGTLAPEERAHAAIFAQNYGEAGALDFFGPRHGLPRAWSGHNNYWYWPPEGPAPSVIVVLGGDEADNREVCGTLEKVAETDCGLCMPYENRQPIWLCRNPRGDLRDLWPSLKRFI